ncbi:hypothetical protein PMIN04_007069 [Paraphaeosphaeria minitans]
MQPFYGATTTLDSFILQISSRTSISSYQAQHELNKPIRHRTLASHPTPDGKRGSTNEPRSGTSTSKKLPPKAPADAQPSPPSHVRSSLGLPHSTATPVPGQIAYSPRMPSPTA